MFPVLPPLGGVRLLGRAAVTAVNHNNVISRSYWSGLGEGRAHRQACRDTGGKYYHHPEPETISPLTV